MVTGATAGNIAQVCGACGCSLSVSRCFKLERTWMKQKPSKTPKASENLYGICISLQIWLVTNKCVWTIHVGPGRSWSEADTAKSEASLPLHRPPPRSPRAQRFHTFCPRRCSFGMSQLKVPVNQFLKRWRGKEFCWFLVVCKIAILWWFDHSSPYCSFVVVIMIETYFFS